MAIQLFTPKFDVDACLNEIRNALKSVGQAWALKQ